MELKHILKHSTTIIFWFLIYLFPVFGQNDLSFDFDYAQFGYDSTSNYVELYYSFSEADLICHQNDSILCVSAILNVEVLEPSTGKSILKQNWNIENPVADSTEQNKNLVGVIRFALPEGNYNFIVEGKDAVDTSKSKMYSEKINIKPLYRDRITISDIQIASNIKNDSQNKNSIFYKNTYEVTPNPLDLYGSSLPVLYFYVEIYNLMSADSAKVLIFQKHIYNSKGVLKYKKSKPVNKIRNSIVEVGVINLAKYPTDSYNLTISLVDSVTNTGIASTKKFFLINPGVVDSTESLYFEADYISSEFGIYTNEECDALFDKSKYIADSEEIENYEVLDSLNSKREFLYKFWKRRDTDPLTANNEFKNEYERRLKFCEERFSTIRKDGYRSDRGRVYLMYGEPDQIDRYPNETNLKPYEIWYYNSIEGGVTFIFGDVTGYSDFELLTSTKRGEMRDDLWIRRISAN